MKTGKTFRAVLQALNRASEGREVILCTKHRLAAYHMAYGMLRDLTEITRTGLLIKFPNGGSLRFSEEFLDLEGVTTVIDL